MNDKTFKMYGYTSQDDVWPRFDVEGAGSKPKMKKTTYNGVPILHEPKRKTTSVYSGRDVHLQAYSAQGQVWQIQWTANAGTGHVPTSNIGRIGLPGQKLVHKDGKLIRWGYVDGMTSIDNRCLVYVGSDSLQYWMNELNPMARVSDLVLPGSHDAGMFEINTKVVHDFSEYLMQHFLMPSGSSKVIDLIKGAIRDYASAFAANLAMTQTLGAYQQMQTGTRYFDFRPATSITDPSDDPMKSFHCHGFIPGANFKDFLKGILGYLDHYQSEVAVVQIRYNGIQVMKPLKDPEKVKQVVSAAVKEQSSNMNPLIVKSLSDIENHTLNDLRMNGNRLIVVLDDQKINDSYNDPDYKHSISDPSRVGKALKSAMDNMNDSGIQYSLLQLQDTASGCIWDNPGDYVYQWAGVATQPYTGSILQYSKGDFDLYTYKLLAGEEQQKKIANSNHMVVLLNDFVEPALATTAEILTHRKLAAR